MVVIVTMFPNFVDVIVTMFPTLVNVIVTMFPTLVDVIVTMFPTPVDVATIPPERGGTAQRKIFHLSNWSKLIHPGPSSSRSSFFNGVELVVRSNADSLLN